MTNKKCNTCEQIKDISEFKISKGNLNKCTICVKEYNRNRYKKRKEKLKDIQKNIVNKTCKICNINKDISLFSLKYDNQDGYCLYCKDCSNLKLRKYYPEKYEKRKQERKERNAQKNNNILSKICQVCKLEKEICNFEKTDFGKYRLNCKNCPVIVYNVYERLKNLHRGHINRYLKNRNKSSLLYLNCNLEQLKNWFEFQFDSEMNWDNFGSYWTIDHIIPLSRFNFQNEKEQDIAFSWTNLQPLKDNFVKNNKIRLYEYFNCIISVHRFIQKFKLNSSGYQIVKETLQWLREYLRYGKKSTDEIGKLSYLFDNLSIEMDNPQPSS